MQRHSDSEWVNDTPIMGYDAALGIDCRLQRLSASWKHRADAVTRVLKDSPTTAFYTGSEQ